ncbi:MAG: hypothetical protein H0V66_11215 [Bdellovibrionales bacterium]|nr:hypothetical protein [Bdellovibrionales bacterium]
MKTVIIVSKCSRIIKLNSTEDWFEFHFKGVCAGEALRKVRLKGRKDFNIRLGEEYLMFVSLISCAGGVFTGEILKLKALAECWDRS